LQERSPPTSSDDIEKYLSSGNAASILATWGEQKAVREIMVFVHTTMLARRGRSDFNLRPADGRFGWYRPHIATA
jgi:hypothetical protein